MIAETQYPGSFLTSVRNFQVTVDDVLESPTAAATAGDLLLVDRTITNDTHDATIDETVEIETAASPARPRPARRSGCRKAAWPERRARASRERVRPKRSGPPEGGTHA